MAAPADLQTCCQRENDVPIREYHCSGCGHDFEVIEGANTVTTACESCGAEKLERLLSMFAAHGSSTGDSPCQDSACSPDACATGACPMMPN
ncbi:MAG: FmdB family transcriptional regulator [Gemmatimonadaceae bacterium]|jgi:putative FmdB family regulatory protein|nr:FmdB family transcriptional regulator [Gemmatimonadaceae bacterium]